MAFRNGYKSIFESLEAWNKYVNYIIGDNYGLPLFIYKDLYQEERLKKWDLYYYFLADTKVKINNKEGIILKNDIKNKKLLIALSQKKAIYQYDQVQGQGKECYNINEDQRELLKNHHITKLFIE